MSDDARRLVREYYAALNRRDWDALDGMLAPDLVHHGLPGGAGWDALRGALAAYHAGFPDLLHTVEDVVAEADRVAVRSVASGTHRGTFLGHAPSGRSFTARALSVHRVEGGLIRETWEVFDTLGMLQQIGLHTPTPSAPPEAGAVAATPRPANAGPGPRPPGPRADVSLAQIRADPLDFLGRLTREHGDYVRYVCDGRETILLNRPDAIRHVLHDRASNYSKLRTPDLLLLKPMLGDGLLTTVGPEWKQDRQAVQPILTRRRMEGAGAVMAEVIGAMLERWRARPNPTAPVDIVREMSRLTLEIAARVLFSTDLTAQSEAFGEAMDVLNESMSHARPGTPDVQRQFGPALALIRQTVWQAVLARKLYDTGDDDLLASLLRSQRERGDSNRHVIDQAVTVLLAGHETTAKALSWAVALLDANPDAAARVVAEVGACVGDRPPTVDDSPNLRYTRAVIDEALRLQPPIWLLTRTALEDDVVAGYEIPAGALVAISPYLIHRHPDFWEDPERFVPDRFLGDDGATQAYRYLPFGHGPRHCVGKFLAMVEMPLVLAAVYSQFTLRSVPGHTLVPEALVTLRPRDGLPMVVTARRAHARAAHAAHATGGCPVWGGAP